MRNSKNTEELHVELKGTTSAGDCVLVTRGEVEHFGKCEKHGLFVVSGIELKRAPSQPPSAGGGRRTWVYPLQLKKHQLRPMTYEMVVAPSVETENPAEALDASFPDGLGHLSDIEEMTR